MSNKQTKRKITVEVASKTSEPPKSRPSVFERLGTKTITTSSQSNEYCRHWSQNGTCPYGKTCKYASTHTLTSPSKRAAKKDEQKKQNRSTSSSSGSNKDDPNKRLHSTIVKALRSPEPEWEQWNQTDLEDADAEMLEKRRQELQRELELQMKMESKLTKTKEKSSAKKGSSSSSSNSSSSSTESSSSSEDTSSTASSSTSLDSRTRKTKRTKRESSSSTEPERGRSNKKKPASKTTHKHQSSSNLKITDKKKTSSPALKTTTKPLKSPSPARPPNRTLSQTPPLKAAKVTSGTSAAKNVKPSARSQSQSQTDRKEKHRTPSPKLSVSASARDRDREPRDRDRERDRVKEKDRTRDKEREKTREKDKPREKERSRERDVKGREREREREREHTNQKANTSRSPKRDNGRQPRDIAPKKKESPSEARSKLSPGQKTRSTNGANSNSSKRDAPTTTTTTNKSSPATSSKDDRRLDRNRDEDKDKDKKKDDRERRDREREREQRERDRDVKDRSLERRKDKRERDDSSRDRNVRDVERRDRERERRMTREEREAAREKEREEALARCQERQRERERLKELAKKERESIPSLLHINTSAATTSANRNRERERDRDRERERDRGLDKPPADRVERLLPLPADRIPPMRKELERQAARSQDRTLNRSNSERGDRNRSVNRGGNDRKTDRDRNSFDYRETRDRDFATIGGRGARDERRHDEKNYDSPYERPAYLDMDHEHYDGGRDRERERSGGGRRDAWDGRDIEPDLVIDEERRRGYGRDEPRPPSAMKERAWETAEYLNRGGEWERNRRSAPQHEWPEDWEQADHNSIEEEWRHYNRSMDSWPSDERRRWPQDFPERRPGPTSISSHRDADEHLEAAPLPPPPLVEEVVKKETILGKRTAETSDEVPETIVKKPCIVPIEDSTILEDALSEISDDADEILNREDVEENYSDNNNINQFDTSINVVQQFNKNDDDFEPVEISKESVEEVSNVVPTSTNIPPEAEQSEIKAPSPPAPVSHDEDGIVDEDGIDNMDFEEISDEELEEEVKVKGLGDALGVDWASLVAESRPRPKVDKAGSAKQRWEYYNVLSRIGVSLEMAGSQILQDILSAQHQEKTDEDESVIGSKAPDPIAAVQVSLNEKSLVRNNLFASAGPYRRALSARRDLAIRRHLCNLPIHDNLDRPKTPDPQFYQNVLQTILINNIN